MIAETFAALKARIEAGQGMVDRVFDTVRVDAQGGLVRDNYAILYQSVPEEIASDRYLAVADYAGRATFVVDVRTVGTTPGGSALLMDRVLSQLVGHRLVVAGRVCDPITVESSGRVAPDTSVKPFLFYADAGFELITRPAP